MEEHDSDNFSRHMETQANKCVGFVWMRNVMTCPTYSAITSNYRTREPKTVVSVGFDSKPIFNFMRPT